MNRLNLRNSRLKFKAAENHRSFLKNYSRIYPTLMKENRRMSTCNRLDLQTLGSQPIMSKNLPHHCSKLIVPRNLPGHGSGASLNVVVYIMWFTCLLLCIILKARSKLNKCVPCTPCQGFWGHPKVLPHMYQVQ